MSEIEQTAAEIRSGESEPPARRARWMKRAQVFDAWLRGRSFGTLVAVLYLLFAVVAFVTGFVRVGLDALLGVWLPQTVDSMRLGMQIFGAMLLAPLMETWLCQTVFLDYVAGTRFFASRPRTVFALSALCFGLQHFYSLGYIVYGCAAGAVLAYAFVSAGRRARGFWVTAAVHAAWNCTVLLLHRYGGD
ncbi:MAG: CPBP family intramembrane metalloprotease [Candidatus Didemnitutus sp.]|nr:CPBP family intramembrane metalloprotease [Candidatus Didemnitutus sp.]